MKRIAMFWLALPVLGVLASGCAVLAPGTGYSGGSATLSDAVEAAHADSTTKVKRMDAGDQQPRETEVVVGTPFGPGGDAVEAPRSHGSLRARHWAADGDGPLFGVVGDGGFLGGGRYDGFGGFGITGGGYATDRLRWDVIGMANSVEFAGKSRLHQAFLNAIDFELDATGRWYLTEPNTFMGVYGIAGVGTGTVFWDYANRLPVVHDGKATTVGDDRINHFDAFGGIGASLMQTRHVHLGVNAVGGVRFYGWHTYEGFENDQLPTTGFGRVLVELNYRL